MAATASGFDTDLLSAAPLGLFSVQLFRQVMDVATLACVAPDPGGWPMRVCPGATEQSTLDRTRLRARLPERNWRRHPHTSLWAGGWGLGKRCPGPHRAATFRSSTKDHRSSASRRIRRLVVRKPSLCHVGACKQRLPATPWLVVRHIRQTPGAAALAGLKWAHTRSSYRGSTLGG
jgi:hypothetical protein